MKLHTPPDEYMSNYDGFGNNWISTSSLSCLMECGVAWYFKYSCREPEQVNVRMTAGSATHKAREVNLKQKVETQADLDKDQVMDVARDTVRDSFEKHEYLETPEFEGKSKKHARDIAVDLAVEFSAEDYDVFQRDMIPAHVEHSLAVEYKGIGMKICGKLDVVEKDLSVEDLKTSKQAFGQTKADLSMQLSTAGLLVLANFKRLPPQYRIQNVIRAKTSGCRTEVFTTGRTMEDLKRQLYRFAAGVKAIEAGNFIPCDPTHWKCSPNYCGFFNKCKYAGGKV